MNYTARELLRREGLSPEETRYGGVSEGYLDYPMWMGPYFEWIRGKPGEDAYLRYKHHPQMDTLARVSRQVPPLGAGGLWWLRDRPLFTENLAELAEADRGGLAVEGGPCLFGADEVYLIFQMRNGSRLCFDGNGAGCVGGCKLRLESFLREMGANVADVSFLNLKLGFSGPELELFATLFSVASALACPLVLSLPDMSYWKYFHVLAQSMPPEVALRAEAGYRAVLHAVVDLYLELAELTADRFPVPRLIALHERAGAVCETFLRARKKFCLPKDVTTNRPDRRESIYDYITLPAAPYYLLGTPRVLEINSTDETDSVRKCAGFHKGRVRFAQLLLPEQVARGGEESVFDAPREKKDYVLLEDLRRRAALLHETRGGV